MDPFRRKISLKSLMGLLVLVFVFNLGRIYSRSRSDSSPDLKLDSSSGNEDQMAAEKMSGLLRQLADNIEHQSAGREPRSFQTSSALQDYKDLAAQTVSELFGKSKNTDMGKPWRLKNVDNAENLGAVEISSLLDKPAINQIEGDLSHGKTGGEGNMAEKTANPGAHVTAKPAQNPPSAKYSKSAPAKTQWTDWYGANTPGHLAGLKKMGLSSVAAHAFKSPYIVDPHVYSQDTVRKPPGYRKKKLITCYNCPQRFYISSHHNKDFKNCPYSECELSPNPGYSKEADMVIFWQNPETDPPQRPAGQLWTHMSWEAPPNQPYPTAKWKDQFNYSISYLRDADFSLPYDNMAWRDESQLHPDSYYVEMAKKKTRTAAWWVSHCQTRSHRMDYVKEMKKYIPDIDIYGTCGKVCDGSHSGDCWTKLNTTYRFYLSFENSYCPEYVTEKFYKVFRYRYPILPIVRGGFEYDKYFLKDTFINAANFASAKDLAYYLIQLGKDPVRLGKMYKEKDRVSILNRKMDWCDFCEKMHTGSLKKKKIIHDIKDYLYGRSCWEAPNDIK